MTVAEELVKKLIEKNYSISCAESCTGGKLTGSIVDVADASKVLQASVVTYSNEAKQQYLEVSEDTLRQFGAVSEETAREMAEGVRALYQSDIAVSTTGNAGPAKGDSDQEVGTVCIGIATVEQTKTYTFRFSQPRNRVIESAVQKVWFLLYRQLLGE